MSERISQDEIRYELASEDYAQSANTLFHFMKKPEYLQEALEKHALIPRYCMENIEYLNVHREGTCFSEIYILEKCFCDIPFHKLTDTFHLKGFGERFDGLQEEEKKKFELSNTHPGLYGEYAIAFSKRWGEMQGLQPVHYLNTESSYTAIFSELITRSINEELMDIYDDDIIERLSLVKPLRGIMKRKFKRLNGQEIEIECYKNFHDEKEWRYIPTAESLAASSLEQIVANPKILYLYADAGGDINSEMSKDKYNSLWLKFSYEDIRYLLVPNDSERGNMIRIIMNISDEAFGNCTEAQNQKNILLSKILVLDEIRKDW